MPTSDRPQILDVGVVPVLYDLIAAGPPLCPFLALPLVKLTDA